MEVKFDFLTEAPEIENEKKIIEKDYMLKKTECREAVPVCGKPNQYCIEPVALEGWVRIKIKNNSCMWHFSAFDIEVRELKIIDKDIIEITGKSKSWLEMERKIFKEMGYEGPYNSGDIALGK